VRGREASDLEQNIRSPEVERHFGNPNHGHLDPLCELKVELAVTDDRIFFVQLERRCQ
jgi:hypothetical protein